MIPRLVTVLSLLATGPVFAESHDPFAPTGDAEAGEARFKQCVACHVVRNEAGETLAGKRGKTGPNLFGVVGRVAGTFPEYKYGKSIVQAGEGGDGFEALIWTEANFVAYVQDPRAFLREYLDDKKARAKMTFKVKKEEDAVNLYAFLHSLAPPEPAEEAEVTN